MAEDWRALNLANWEERTGQSQLAAYIDRLQELGVIQRKPDMARLVQTSFVDSVRV